MPFGSVPAWGDSAWTIAEIATIAWSNHPAAVAAHAGLHAAAAERERAQRRPSPDADIGAGHKTTDATSGYEATVALQFPVERRGKRETRMGIAESGVQVAAVDARILRHALERHMRVQAYAFLAAEAHAEYVGQAAEWRRTLAEQFKQRSATSPALLLEQRVIEAGALEMEQSARSYAAQRDAARAQLNLLMQRAPDAPLHLRERLEVPQKTYALESLLARIEESPLLLKSRAELERAQHEAEAVRLEAMPDYRVGPYVAHEEAGEPETTLGVAFSVPLSWPRRIRSATAAAEAQRRAAEAAAATQALDARIALVHAHRMYEAALAQAADLAAEQLEPLDDAVALAGRQYQQGTIPAQLFLELQREWLEVHRLRIEAVLDTLTYEMEMKGLVGQSYGEDAP